MIAIDPITSAQLQLSVNINGIFVRLKVLAEGLQRFCRPIAFYNDHEHFDLSFSGSGLLINDRGRRLVLCSGHQLSNLDRAPSEMVIILEDERGLHRVGLPPDSAVRSVLVPSSDPELADAADILLAEYSSDRPGHDLARHFLSMNLADTPDLTQVSDPDIIFAIGYPAADLDYDPVYDEDYNLVEALIVSRWTKLYLRPAERTVWDSKPLVPLRPATDDVFVHPNPDGMSGSPVFFVHGLRQREPKLGFAGMLVRGNNAGRHNMLPASVIFDVVERSRA